MPPGVLILSTESSVQEEHEDRGLESGAEAHAL